jgi:hypothetical protein
VGKVEEIVTMMLNVEGERNVEVGTALLEVSEMTETTIRIANVVCAVVLVKAKINGGKRGQGQDHHRDIAPDLLAEVKVK